MIENTNKTLGLIKSLKLKLAHLVERFINPSSQLGDGDIEVDRKEHWLIRVPSLILGNIYHFIKNEEERLRVWSYNFVDGISELRILYEVLYHSRHLITVLIFLISGSFSLFFIKGGIINIADKNLITDLLTAYVGGATAILGIIFALYSVGFQMTTERFSSRVTDYLNREKVGQFFFKLLILAAVFSLFNLLLQLGIAEPVIPPFIISTFLITTSLFGILIFKDDYITKLKPRQVFERIYWQNIEAIRLVNLCDYPKVKSFKLTRQNNIKSFKLYLPIHNSWSLMGNLQKQIDDRLDILESFYRDLKREQKVEDATFGIVSLGYLLAEYVAIKPFIEQGYGWWFPEYQEVVTAESAEMFPIKANYEAMGVGRLGVTKKDFNWLENKIVNFLNQIQKQTDFSKEPLIGNSLISAYETILAGHYTKTNKGYEKKLKGVYENQDFVLTEKVLSQFVDLGERLAGIEKCHANYINSFGQVKTTIIDGFSLRHFPGKLEDWRPYLTKKVEKLIDGQKLVVSKEDIIAWKLPSYLHSLLTGFQEQLEVEDCVEKRLVTPKKWLIEEALKKSEATEKETLDKFQKNLITSIIRLIKLPNGQLYRDHFGGVILGMFSQLIYQERWAELESLIKKHSTELLSYFVTVGTDQFLELELRESIDTGVFEALVARRKNVYFFYLRLFLLAQIHISGNKEQPDIEKLLKTVRRPLMLGGLAYLVSELDEDFYYVIEFTKHMERLYPHANLADFYDNAIKLEVNSEFGTSFRIGYEEANRYRMFYRRVINSIRELPKDYIVSGSVPYGLHSTETVKHPSKFIRKMAAFTFSDMEQCFEGYVEWLRKRDLIKKVILLIKARTT